MARVSQQRSARGPARPRPAGPALIVRGAFAGVLMGLANLVPGISGGTMLLAAGVYTGFIEAIAEVTTLRFRGRSLLLLVSIGVGAVGVVVSLAGPVGQLVATRRWIMYSLFIGLTLGGVPLVWRMARPATPGLFAGTAAGFAAMALMSLGGAGGAGPSSMPLLVVAGIAGASAMILPGISGAYMLLVLGQYEVVLAAIAQVKAGLANDFDQVVGAMRVVIPVAIGVVIGVVGISNLLRWTLRRFPKSTLGFLLGLLFGSVIGIWPFQTPAVDHAAAYFAPTAMQAAASVALGAAGLALTLAIDRLGRNTSTDEKPPRELG